jgi:predicted DNA-binding ribbon-helix-helix protein
VKSLVRKRSLVIAGRKTSVSLEDAFWEALKQIAIQQHMVVSELAGAIDSKRQHGNLSSAIRLFVLDFYRRRSSDSDQCGRSDVAPWPSSNAGLAVRAR